jgi:hypothetical protein
VAHLPLMAACCPLHWLLWTMPAMLRWRTHSAAAALLQQWSLLLLLTLVLVTVAAVTMGTCPLLLLLLLLQLLLCCHSLSAAVLPAHLQGCQDLPKVWRGHCQF